ncbi:MAG: hypothetical protein EHM57_04970 [Actinobacteria bacterium]|nr:MAG: hypothetical protein EHM57_04970 [Actinomycetota bacterium]
MKIEELMTALREFPPNAEVTVAVTPGSRVPIRGTRVTMERDAGELCQPAEVTLLVNNGADSPNSS